jgi:hypothetical protein
VVTFIDERKKMRIPQRAKPKNMGEEKKKRATFKGTPDVHHRKACILQVAQCIEQ